MEVLASDARSGLSGRQGCPRSVPLDNLVGGVVVRWCGGVRVVRVCSIGELLLFLHMMLVMRDGAGVACLAAPIL
jgi:hypothetical protein